MKTKIKTASCGCAMKKVHARYRRQGWKCEWEKQGKMCESLAEGQVYCHTHFTAHTVICGHPTEHVTKVTEPTVPVIQPTNDVPEWLTRLRAMSLREIIEFQRKLGELQ
jgi:hypothetical protein